MVPNVVNPGAVDGAPGATVRNDVPVKLLSEAEGPITPGLPAPAPGNVPDGLFADGLGFWKDGAVPASAPIEPLLSEKFPMFQLKPRPLASF